MFWASYPNMGVDERNQFELLADVPGGLAALRAATAAFRAAGVRVGLAYNPWDSGTAPANATDAAMLARTAVAVGADFLNGDTMNFMPRTFFDASVAAGRPLALQPEGGPSLQGLEWTKMGWGYWPQPFVPAVDMFKWVERRHMTQICNRWATNHTTDLQQVCRAWLCVSLA